MRDISVCNNDQFQSFRQNYNVFIIPTAFVNVKCSTNNVFQCRTFINNASQNDFISKYYVERWSFPLYRTTHMFEGINGIFTMCLKPSLNLYSPHTFQIITTL